MVDEEQQVAPGEEATAGEPLPEEPMMEELPEEEATGPSGGFAAPELPTRQAGAMAGSAIARVGQMLEPDSGTREANGDDLSDLFQGPDPEDLDVNFDDLVEVDEEDVFGGSDDLSDLTDVSYEDVMGEDFTQPRVVQRAPIRARPVQYAPAGMSGMG